MSEIAVDGTSTNSFVRLRGCEKDAWPYDRDTVSSLAPHASRISRLSPIAGALLGWLLTGATGTSLGRARPQPGLRDARWANRAALELAELLLFEQIRQTPGRVDPVDYPRID